MTQGRVYVDHWRLLFPSLYLSAADLRGRDVTLTIDRVELEELQREGGELETKPVMRFAELERRAAADQRKRLVLNKTNMATIAGIVGDGEVRHWTGHRVTLYSARVQAFGRWVDAIRIRPPEDEPHDDDDGFDPSHREPQGDEVQDAS